MLCRMRDLQMLQLPIFKGMDFILWMKLNFIPVRKAKCARGIELITRIVAPTGAEQ